jgi:hypothetical protein
MVRTAVLIALRVVLVLLGTACALFGLWIYCNFPAGGNGDASRRAALWLELATGGALAALLCFLLTFLTWRAPVTRPRQNASLERAGREE